jgi:hypothetical protein
MTVPSSSSASASASRPPAASTPADAAASRHARPTVAHTAARFAQVLATTRKPRDAHAVVAARGGPPKPATSTRRPLGADVHAPAHGRVAPREHERAEGKRDGDEGDDVRHAHGRAHARADDPLDPMRRQTAMLAPPPITPPSAAEAAAAPRARMSLEELMPLLVRRIAWAGDQHKASVRLELGAGAYAGATLLVHADQGRVRVEVSGACADELRGRLEERLRRHGLDVESVT